MNNEKHQPITVVVPTMWRHSPFLDFAQDFLELNVVEHLIIIDNDISRRPNHPVLTNSKITIFEFGKNIFVNPAWNLGVNNSKTNIVCILNDDLNFDIRLFNRVSKFIKPDMGAIGLSNGIAEFGQTILTDGMINFEPFHGQICEGFGNLMFVHKSTWKDIPDGLNIAYGDNFIFEQNLYNNRTNYFIVNMFHHHAASTTVKEVLKDKDVKDVFWLRESLLYKDIKAKLMNRTF